MKKPLVKCLLSIVLSVVLMTMGFSIFTNAATAYPIYSYDETELVYNGGTSFSLNCTIFDPTYLCRWVAYDSTAGISRTYVNSKYFPTNGGNLTGNNFNSVNLYFGLTGFQGSNSRDHLTSGQLPVGTVVRFDFAIKSYFNGSSYTLPVVRHYNGVNTTSWLYPDGYSSETYVSSEEITYYTYDFTITALNSYLGSEFYWSTYSAGGAKCHIYNINIQYTFPIEDAEYCLNNGIITEEQYNVIYNTLHPGGSGTDIAPWLQGDSNEYPTVIPDTLPPEVESFDTLFVPSDIDDSQIQSYLDRLDIGSWFRDFWAKMNSINIYLILIVIVLVLIFIRTLFMNFSNFIPK